MRHIRYKALFVGVAIALISGGIWVQYLQHKTNEARLAYEIKTKQELIEKKTIEVQKLNGNTQELQKQKEQLEKEKEDLNNQLQAKLEEKKRIADSQIQVTGTARAQVSGAVAVSGTCADWLAQAGVTDVNSAMILINKESGCNPNAVNRSSGACGIAQELPCGKSGCSLGDGPCQIAWMQNYVNQRYGGWANALSFHYSHNWY